MLYRNSEAENQFKDRVKSIEQRRVLCQKAEEDQKGEEVPQKIDQLNKKIDYIIQNTREKFDEMNKVFNENLQKLVAIQQSRMTSKRDSLALHESESMQDHLGIDQSFVQFRYENKDSNEESDEGRKKFESFFPEKNSEKLPVHENPMLAFIEDGGVISPNFHFTSPILSKEIQPDLRNLSPMEMLDPEFGQQNLPRPKEHYQGGKKKTKVKFTGIVEGNNLKEINNSDPYFMQKQQEEEEYQPHYMKILKNPSEKKLPILAPQNSRSRITTMSINYFDESLHSSNNDGNYLSVNSPLIYNNSELSQKMSEFHSYEENSKVGTYQRGHNMSNTDISDGGSKIDFGNGTDSVTTPHVSHSTSYCNEYNPSPKKYKRIQSDIILVDRPMAKSNLREVKTIRKNIVIQPSNLSGSISISDHYMSQESTHSGHRHHNSLVSEPSTDLIIEAYSDIPTIAFDENFSQSDKSHLFLKHSLERIDEVEEDYTDSVRSNSEFSCKNISVNSKKINMMRLKEQPKSQLIEHDSFRNLRKNGIPIYINPVKKSIGEFTLDEASNRSKMEISDLKNLVNECLEGDLVKKSHDDYLSSFNKRHRSAEKHSRIQDMEEPEDSTTERFVDSTSKSYNSNPCSKAQKLENPRQ